MRNQPLLGPCPIPLRLAPKVWYTVILKGWRAGLERSGNVAKNMPKKGFYADEHEFIEELSFHADKASHLGSMSAGIAKGGGVKIKTDGFTIFGTQPGDVLIFGTCQWEKTRCGDVILVRMGQSTFPRRVVSASFTGTKYVFVTKTDSSDEVFDPIMGDLVIGKLTSIERGSQKLSPSKVRGGFYYRYTECNTRSVIEKVLDTVLMFIPKNVRPTTIFREYVARKKRAARKAAAAAAAPPSDD